VNIHGADLDASNISKGLCMIKAVGPISHKDGIDLRKKIV
jgi:hypothetical protein